MSAWSSYQLTTYDCARRSLHGQVIDVNPGARPSSPHRRLWARDAAIEKKDVLKARGYTWSPGEFGRPKCWYRDVADADRAAEVAWLRANVMGPAQAVWALRITARDRYSDRCWGWGTQLTEPLVHTEDRSSLV